MSDFRTLTKDDLISEATRLFGDEPMDWAFECPNCGDVATGRDFRKALEEHPRTGSDGKRLVASDLTGQECIGRTLGALKGPPTADGRGEATRGCDWTANGLFRGPWRIELPEDREMWAFPLADRNGS